MEDVDAKKVDAVCRSSRFREKGNGMILEENGTGNILRFLSENGYRSCEALELRKEIEQSKQKYESLIEKQSNMPGKDKLAEAVIKYYLFQLEKLKKALPYDAMGCESTVPLLMLQEFQKETIVEDITRFLGNPDDLIKKELKREVQKFCLIHLDPGGTLLCQALLIQGNRR